MRTGPPTAEPVALRLGTLRRPVNVDREITWADHSPSSPFRDQIYVMWHTGVPAFVAPRTTARSPPGKRPFR